MRSRITEALTLGTLAFFTPSGAAQPDTGPTENSESFRSRNPDARLPYSDIARRLRWVGPAVLEPEYTVWGASPILDDNGRVHLYAARWPEANVDPAWRKSSEIAHYVADRPEGPFRFRDVALTGTGGATWDRWSAHNPEVRKYEGRYALLYVSNSDYRQPPHPLNQHIGMAVADCPDGPWKRVGDTGEVLADSPEPRHWTHGSMIVNPALLKVDDRYHLYFKSRCQGREGLFYGVAVADRLEGPYEMAEAPLTSEGVVIEDGTVFHWEDRICLLTTDNHGKVTGIRGGGALWVSEDGLRFDLEKTQIGYDLIPSYLEGYDAEKVVRVYGSDPKFERPKILCVNGQPRWLYACSGWTVHGGPRTASYVLRIDLVPGDGPLRPTP